MSIVFPVIITGSAVFALVLAIDQFLWREKRYLYQRLQAMTEQETEADKKEKFNLKLVLGLFGRFFLPKNFTKRLTGELIKAGIPLKGEEFISVVGLAALLPALFLWGITSDPVVASIFLGGGFLTPKLILSYAKGKRIRRFNDQIGDALLVMANSLRAGFSFVQSMEMVAREMSEPIAGEFSRALREMQLGTTTEKALTAMAERVGSDDLDMIVTAVLIQRQVGGNLAEVLENISQTIRERIRIAGEIKTLTAQGKISGTIIGLLPFLLAVVLYLINGSYLLTLFTDPIGMMMVVTGIVSQLVGMILIRKIVSLEY